MLVVFWVVPYKQERWSRYSHQRVRARLVEQLLLLERELLLHVPLTSRMRLRSPRPWAWRPPDQWWARHVVGHQPVEAQRVHYEPRRLHRPVDDTQRLVLPGLRLQSRTIWLHVDVDRRAVPPRASWCGPCWSWTLAPSQVSLSGAIVDLMPTLLTTPYI